MTHLPTSHPTQARLADLAARAATPPERLALRCVPLPGNEGVAAARLDRWAAAAGRGDLERLRRVLRWRGMDLDALRPMLGPVRLPDDAPPPEWIAGLRRLLSDMRGLPQGDAARLKDADSPIPHENVLAPFAAAAGWRLRRKPSVALSETVLVELERLLLSRLCKLAGRILGPEAYLFARRRPDAGDMEFAAEMLAGDVPAFIRSHPVAGRLITLGCDNWVAMVEELDARLSADGAALAEMFAGGQALGPAVSIEIGDADLHDGNRSVVILGFASGVKVVYKPRPLHLDVAYKALLDWLGERGYSVPLLSPTCLSRESWGWAGFIEHAPAEDEAALSRFYRRAGGLACLAYVLNSSDLHYGNLIAAGEHPVLIDLETMLQPEWQVPVGAEAAPVLDGPWSLLSSMLLPIWSAATGGIECDRSGLGGPGQAGTTHLPFTGPVEAVLWRHREALSEGFAEMYRLLMRERPALEATDGPLAALSGHPVRLVKRDTSLYFTLLVQSLGDTALSDGVEHFLGLERLAHLLSLVDADTPFTALVAREQAALAALDIPRFTMATDGLRLEDGAGPIFEETGAVALEVVRRRLAKLSEDDLKSRVGVLRALIEARVAALPEDEDRLTRAAPVITAAPFDTASAVAVAADVVRQASRRRAAGEEATALLHLPTARRFMPATDSGAGLALLTAALYAVTGEPCWRDEARDLLRPLLDNLSRLKTAASLRAGIASGIGLEVFTVAWAARLLPGGEAVASLAEIGWHTDRVRRPGLDGAAGGLLARLAAGCAVDADMLALGDGLAADIGKAARGGLLTGLDGDALALAHLHRASGEPRFAAAAAQAIAAADRHRAEPPLLDWADGAAGWAAARLVAGHDPSRWLDLLAAAGEAPVDGLCAGTCGEIDVLLEGARRLARPDLGEAAARRGAGLLRRYRDTGGWPCFVGPGAGLVPFDLLNGAAGIAYQLLRLAAPGRLPSLALLEIDA